MCKHVVAKSTAAMSLWPGREKVQTQHRQPGQATAGTIRATLRKHGWKRALGMVSEMELKSLEQDLSLLLSVAAKSARWLQALACARKMGSHQGASEAANCWGAGGWRNSLQIIQALLWLGFEVAIETLNAASSSCERHGRHGRPGGASRRSWLWSMRCLRQAVAKGLRASSVSLNSAMASVGNSLRWHRGCDLLHAGLRSSLVPDDISLNTLMTACEKTANWELAARMSLVHKTFSIEPDIIGRNAVISSCANSGQWRLASVWLSSSGHAGMSASQVSIAAMATAGERSNQWRIPLQLLDSHRSLSGAVLYGAALDALESWGRWTQALQLFDELSINFPAQRPWLDPMTVSATVSACSRAEEWNTSLILLDDAWQNSHGRGLSTAAWNACIRASAGHVSLELLLLWMQKTRFSPDMLSYAALETEGIWLLVEKHCYIFMYIGFRT